MAGPLTELKVTDASAFGVRAVISPLLTLATALMDALGDRPPTPWRSLLRNRASGLDSGPLEMFARPAFGLPNGLLPLPSATAPTFDEEIAALRACPTTCLVDDIQYEWQHRGLPPELGPFVDDPTAAVGRYADALEVHWDRMLRPSWPRVRRLLEREVLQVGHVMARDGVEGMLRTLHPKLAYDDGKLRFQTGHWTRPSYVARDTLTIAPLACELDRFLVNEDHPDATVIAYPARGSAELWEEGGDMAGTELTALLGPARAAIALALAIPATTTDLADRLRLAPSTVSHHLGWLTDAGLVVRTRRGHAVYYRLTARGEALLDLY